jgi:hypothetical protein
VSKVERIYGRCQCPSSVALHGFSRSLKIHQDPSVLVLYCTIMPRGIEIAVRITTTGSGCASMRTTSLYIGGLCMDFSVPRAAGIPTHWQSSDQLVRLFFLTLRLNGLSSFRSRLAPTVRVNHHVQGPNPTWWFKFPSRPELAGWCGSDQSRPSIRHLYHIWLCQYMRT